MMAKFGDFLAESLRVEKTASSASLDAIFEERPVTLDEFVTGKQFLNNPRLSDIQYNAVRHLEQVFYPETYTAMEAEWGDYWKPVRFINFAYLQWGKGAGKDFVSGIAAARIAYLLICLRSPQKYFELPHQADIHMLNVASTASQAQRAYFKQLRALLVAAPWFADKFAGDLPGEQAGAVRFKKQIELISGHSQAESMEGLNLILGVADEISAFRSKEEAERFAVKGGREPSKTAESILEMLRTSASTRFPETFKIVAISYPRFKGDAIQQLCMRARDDNELRGASSRFYVEGPLASWDVNPRLRKAEFIDHPNSPTPIPNLPAFVEDFTTDPVMARAKYLCQPELSANRFFRNEEMLFAAFGERKLSPITLNYEWGIEVSPNVEDAWWLKEESGLSYATPAGWQVNFEFAPDFIPIQGAAYAMHGDMAIKGDRAGIALCHVRNFVEAEHEHQWHAHDLKREMSERRPVVKIDYVGSFEADITAKPFAREVQIRWYRKLIYELISRGFNIQSVTFDRFESADTIQILNSQGIEAKRVSMDTSTGPWENLRDIMYDGRLEAYWRPQLVDELLALTRLGNGKLDHPPGGSKDEADAVAGAVLGAVTIGGSEGEAPIRVGMEVESFSLDGGRWVAESGFDTSAFGIDTELSSYYGMESF